MRTKMLLLLIIGMVFLAACASTPAAPVIPPTTQDTTTLSTPIVTQEALTPTPSPTPSLTPSSTPTPTQTSISTSCGAIGVAAYQEDLPQIPSVDITPRGTSITVITSSDAIDGDVSSVQALITNPGPDGISLREALDATNRSPGIYTIHFDPKLAGATIKVGSWNRQELPPLTGGNVLINGDIDSDGRPDITISNNLAKVPEGNGFRISSGGNTLHSLAIDNFRIAVLLEPLSTNRTFADNSISNLVIRTSHAMGEGIDLYSKVGNSVSVTRNRWVNTIIAGNTIEVAGSGISLMVHHSAEDSLEHTTIVNNTVKSLKNEQGQGINVGIGLFAGADGNKAADILIADNSIEGTPYIGIRVAAGQNGSNANTVDGVRILGNHLDLQATTGGARSMGIMVIVGDAASDEVDLNYRPITLPEVNRITNIWIEGNTVKGARKGIDLTSGTNGARRNTISLAFVRGNTIVAVGDPGHPTYGVFLEGGGGFSKVESTPARENEISDVTIEANTIQLISPIAQLQSGGVAIIAGQLGGEDNRIANVRVTRNEVDGGGVIGLSVLGGWGNQDAVSSNNAVLGVEMSCNSVTNGPTQIRVQGASGVKGISLIGGYNGAKGNKVENIRLYDNLVAGIMNNVSVYDNVRGSGSEEVVLGNMVQLPTTTRPNE